MQSHPPPFELHFPSSSPPLSTTEPINAPFTPQMQPTTLHNSRIHPKPFIHPHPNPHPHQTQASTATTRTQQQQHPKNQPRRAPESRRAIHNSPTHPAQPLQTLTSSSVKPHPKSHFPRPRRPHRKRTSRRHNSPRKSTHSQHNRAATSTAQIFVRLRRPTGSAPFTQRPHISARSPQPSNKTRTGSTALTTGQLHLQRKSSYAFGAQQERPLAPRPNATATRRGATRSSAYRITPGHKKTNQFQGQ